MDSRDPPDLLDDLMLRCEGLSLDGMENFTLNLDESSSASSSSAPIPHAQTYYLLARS